ncbi:hypothetical protein LCGC14_1954790, partial [marine sediment metagenome]
DVEKIKIRYSPSELEKMKDNAKKLGIPINEYQLEMAKKAQVKVEVKDEV